MSEDDQRSRATRVAVGASVAHAYELYQVGAAEAAEQECLACLAAEPLDARALSLLARVRRRLGRIEQALAAAQGALEIVPDLVPALIELAAIQRQRGEPRAAAVALQRVVALQPTWHEAGVDLAMLELELGEVEAARERFLELTQAAPALASAWRGLAESELRRGRDWEAYRSAQQRAIDLLPSDALVCDDLGVACRAVGEFELAARAYDQALERRPDLLPVRWARFQAPERSLYLDSGEVEVFKQQWQRGLAYFEQLDFERADIALQTHDTLRRATAFYRDYVGLDTLDLTRRYGALVERMSERMFRRSQRTRRPPPRRPDGRIRVAFVSAFLRRHTVTEWFGALMTELDPARFERCLVHLDPSADDETERLRAGTDRYSSSDLDARAAHAQLVELAPDIIVYPDLGMHPIAQILGACRLAPVQCMLWGHPVTSGNSTIDYFLSSAAMEPPEPGQRYHERCVLLPGLGTCYREPIAPTHSGLAIPARAESGTVHYLIAQNVAKQLPEHDAVWAEIAAQVPGARFSFAGIRHRETRVLLEQRLRRAFARTGARYDGRVHMFPFLSRGEFFALARDADLNLDTVGWSGGRTTLDVSAQGTPTVTLPGATMRSRQTSAMLDLMELGELSAANPAAYVRLAIELGCDGERRQALRESLRQRKHVLYGDRSVIVAFSEFLERAHDEGKSRL